MIVGTGKIRFQKHAKGNWNAVYRYNAEGKKAIAVAAQLLPFAVSKYKADQMTRLAPNQLNISSNSVSMSESEATSWLTGIFEGEGHAMLHFVRDSGCRYRLVGKEYKQGYWARTIGITNTQKDLIDRVKSIAGFGHIHLQPYKTKTGIKKAFVYAANGSIADSLAKTLMPFCASARSRNKLLKIIRYKEAYIHNKGITISPKADENQILMFFKGIEKGLYIPTSNH